MEWKLSMEPERIDSKSMGDPSRHLPFEVIAERFAARPAAPKDRGRVALLVSRGAGGLRSTPARAELTVEGGMPGDKWGRRATRKAEMQLATMQLDVATLLAGGQPLALFGDNLFLDLDLSEANLPIGTRLRAGAALLEVTPKPHDGCSKFHARFGADALRFISEPVRRPLNLRGIYLRVVEAGVVAVGDEVVVLRAERRDA